MTLCAGCNRQADMVFKGNDSLGLCIPCAHFLPLGSGNTYLMRNLPRRPCESCDSPMYHGGRICVNCRIEFMQGIAKIDETLLDDNPFIYDICYAGISFNQYIQNRENNVPADSVWLNLHHRVGAKKVTFTGVVYPNAEKI